MNTTLMFRTIANPRRTTLAHLVDAEEQLQPAPAAAEREPVTDLPARTANPRRTVLLTAPQSAFADEAAAVS